MKLNSLKDREELQSALHRLGLPPTYPQVILYRQSQCPGKGLGLKAARNIPRGTPILAEAELFWIAGTPDPPPVQASKPEFQALSCPVVPHTARARFAANNFEMGKSGRRMKRGIFVTASRFNHSCVPNAHFTWNAASKLLTIHAIVDITQGQEIFLNYHPKDYLKPAIERQQELRTSYSFVCGCPACQPNTDSKRASEARRQWMAGLNSIIGLNQNTHTQGQREQLLANIQFFGRQLQEERLFYPQLADVYGKEISWYRREIQLVINGAGRTRLLYKEEALKVATAKLDLDVVCSGHDSSEVRDTLRTIRELRQV